MPHVHNANPLRRDPTRTSLIRRQFSADLNNRFRRLRGDIIDFMVTQDALGLKEKKLGFTIHVQPREFAFRSDPEKLDAFNEWLRERIEANIFSVPAGTPPRTPWTAKYIQSGYRQGLMSAFFASKKEFEEFERNVDQFIRSSFNQPETINKVRLLATRAFEDLKGVTSAMSAQMNRILAQGLAEGKHPTEIAREMNEKISNLTRTRALLIAQTEIIRAHAEGTLDAFEELGIDGLEVKAEFSTAGDDRVCPKCEKLEGVLFTIDEARGLIPVHPLCRCTLVPYVNPEPKKSRRKR